MSDLAKEQEPDELDIFAVTTYETPVAPESRSFKPWHKPRKQYVRGRIWHDEVDWLISSKDGNQTVFRYLGLPGEDFLDIRYIYNEFNRRFECFEFLGFDRSAHAENSAANISLQEVKNLSKVHPVRSWVLPDDFARLSNQDSMAWQSVRKIGPVDVINLDLCDEFGNAKPEFGESVYNAFRALFMLQSRRIDPWSIFLTTRIDKDTIDANARTVLGRLIQDNLEQCDPFKTQFLKLQSDGKFEDLSAMSGGQYFNAVSIGYAKWFANLAVEIKCEFSIASAVKYTVNYSAGCPDMLSVVFRFVPLEFLTVDKSGLGTGGQWKTLPTECQMIKKVPGIIGHTLDVDELLEKDTRERDRVISESKSLLKQARYDADSYEEWANGDLSKGSF